MRERRNGRSALAAALAALSVSGVVSAQEQECGLYLAESSTSTADEPVWGTFAGKDLQPGDLIGYPELAVQALHFRANNKLDEASPVPPHIVAAVEYLEEMFWIADGTGGRFELAAPGKVIGLVTGPGSTSAYHAQLQNAEWDPQPPYQRPVVGEQRGQAHASRGAISPFYQIELKAHDKIAAGTEIFVNYGSSWTDDDDGDDEDDIVKDDFAKIDVIVDKMIAFFDKHGNTMSSSKQQEVYDFLLEDILTAAVGETKASKIKELLPNLPDSLKRVKEAGGSLLYSQPTVQRSLSWLNEHGFCMDNLKMGPSNIPNAGRGAIATRALGAGTVVAPVPLLPLPSHSILDMYQFVHGTRTTEFVVGQQLLLNYCLGHAQSTALLCPAGSGVGFVNHNGDEPNVKLVWSKHKTQNNDWFQRTPEQWMEQDLKFPALLMELVAIRDIAKGEEVLLDYGPEWKAAWDKHQTRWKSRLDKGDLPSEWPLRAVDWQDDYRNKPYETETEQEVFPYPENIKVAAFLMFDSAFDKNSGSRISPKHWGSPPPNKYFIATHHLVEVEVIDREEVEESLDGSLAYNYTVRAHYAERDYYVRNVPHSALVYLDVPETGDQFTKGAFRHWIGVPDEIFPQGPWRNKPATRQQEAAASSSSSYIASD